MFKLIGQRSIDAESLASQPTLSRLENRAQPADLQRMIDFLIDTGIERLQHKHGGGLPKQITFDLDPTDDPCHR